MTNIILVILAAVLLVVLVLALIWVIRAQNFRPTKNKRRQLRKINRLVEPSGFAYEPSGDYFYSLMYCWQRQAGYCRSYDEAAPFFNMIMDCEPIPFEYGGKRWLIELWKGQYGITTGAEIGIYSTSRADIESDKFSGTFYEAIRDDEMLDLSFTVRRNGEVLISRRARHWWLTGFALSVFSQPEALTMEAHIEFPNAEMLDAFLQSLLAAGYQTDEYQVQQTTITIQFTEPHTPQPANQTGLQREVAQGLNQTNCALFKTVTEPYTDTLDRLEFLHGMAPNLFDFMLDSLYAKGVFEAFEWLVPNQTLRPPHKPRRHRRNPQPTNPPVPCGRRDRRCPCCSCCPYSSCCPCCQCSPCDPHDHRFG